MRATAASSWVRARSAAPSPQASYSHFAVVSVGTPSASGSVWAADADGASPMTARPCSRASVVSAARVVVFPAPAGPDEHVEAPARA